MATPVPVACNPAALDGAQAARYDELRKAMEAATLGRRALPDGYGISFVADPVTFTRLAEWITLERLCCPFLSFTLDWSGADGLWLKLTGGPDVARFLHAHLGPPE